MSTQTIPESYTHTCDRCGHTEASRHKQKASNWSHYAAPFDHERIEQLQFDLCPACSQAVSAVVMDRGETAAR